MHSFINEEHKTHQGLVKYNRIQQQTCLSALLTNAGIFAELHALLTDRVAQSAYRLTTTRTIEFYARQGQVLCFRFHI
jgi:hypothetical protein